MSEKRGPLRAKDQIRFPDGSVTTLGEAIDRGLVKLRCSEEYNAVKEKTVYSYGAWFGEVGWAITPGLYRSRMGLPVIKGK